LLTMFSSCSRIMRTKRHQWPFFFNSISFT
jgi:hypothetical protein